MNRIHIAYESPLLFWPTVLNDTKSKSKTVDMSSSRKSISQYLSSYMTGSSVNGHTNTSDKTVQKWDKNQLKSLKKIIPDWVLHDISNLFPLSPSFFMGIKSKFLNYILKI